MTQNTITDDTGTANIQFDGSESTTQEVTLVPDAKKEVERVVRANTSSAKDAPKPKQKPCKLVAEGEFKAGVARLKTDKKCSIECTRAQIIIIEQEGMEYTYVRTEVGKSKTEGKTS